MGRIFNLDSPLMSALNKLADLIFLNILTFICCIPIITIGASLTSMHYVLLKMVRNEDSYITKSFFKSFKENFKQATIIWLIMLLIIIVIVGDLLIFSYSGIEFPTALKIAFAAVGFLVLMSAIYVFPLLSRFENTIRGTLKNSVFMAILSLPKTILMIVCYILPLAVMYFSMNLLPIVFFLGISGPAFLAAYLYNGIFKKFEPAVEEEVEKEWFIELTPEERERMKETAGNEDNSQM